MAAKKTTKPPSRSKRPHEWRVPTATARTFLRQLDEAEPSRHVEVKAMLAKVPEHERVAEARRFLQFAWDEHHADLEQQEGTQPTSLAGDEHFLLGSARGTELLDHLAMDRFKSMHPEHAEMVRAVTTHLELLITAVSLPSDTSPDAGRRAGMLRTIESVYRATFGVEHQKAKRLNLMRRVDAMARKEPNGLIAEDIGSPRFDANSEEVGVLAVAWANARPGARADGARGKFQELSAFIRRKTGAVVKAETLKKDWDDDRKSPRPLW